MQTNRCRLVFLIVLAGIASNCFAQTNRAPEDRTPPADAVVAADGSGDYTSIQDAVYAAPYRPAGPAWVILVKPGTYNERVYIQRERGNLRIVGEEASSTILTYHLNAKSLGDDGQPLGTFRTPTLQVDGERCEFAQLTIQNSAGPGSQALAMRTDGDKLVFRDCQFLGWQDTLLLNRGRAYFERCRIEGHVDFIFGAATAWFEACDIHLRGSGYITAASTPQEQSYGFVFHRCRVTSEPDVRAYLGRPWRSHAMTCFLQCELSESIRPEGWHNWSDPARESTVRYSEYQNSGPGAAGEERVTWATQLNNDQAEQLTMTNVLSGDDGWNPEADRAKASFTPRGWSDMQSVLDRIEAPTFPNRRFDITQYGAKLGERCTAAIQQAIDACHEAGGGRVVVPAGTWPTGALVLRSNVNLHLEQQATLEWVFDLDEYPLVFTRWEGTECMNYSPLIYAFEQQNIAITGQGTLDGGATHETWWAWNPKDPALRKRGPALQVKDRNALVEYGTTGKPVSERVFGAGHYLRPNFIQPYRCQNVLIEGVTIVRSPMWVIHPVLSQSITVRGVTIESHGANSDGCDPESCRDVLIEDTLFDTGDDCIAIKSGRNNDGRRVDVPSENIIVRRCTMKDGHGGVVLGSECSGDIRNVWVEDCQMDSPHLDRALRFKNNAERGGVLENVFMRNVQIGQVAEAVLTIDLLYEEGPNGPHQAIVRNIELQNVTSTASPRVMYVRGYEGAIIDNIRFANCEFAGISATEVIEHAGSISMEHVTIRPQKTPR
ncbi:pectinesterase family protein [Aeoliella mucimassa]|uniref:Pectinesterase A n=1 Tax=Aeoliella mucimassa TaxID=2527972 RepID=A0A518AP89_9BACT|nr:pectinesterase family protein [Aeoliella mucimassa]QDU56546.1 Pectinesterase A precursor [Aeoliella mucimassa]